jgi:hypothetical protein
MSPVGHQLPLEAVAERVRYAPISGPYLKPIKTTECAKSIIRPPTQAK